MRLLKNVLIPMDDGVKIAADVYLPDAEGRYPAVFYFGPYRKEDWILHGSMSGLPDVYTGRGYALVMGDIRGTNDSEGVAERMFTPREQQDAYEMVEWMAGQPWCDGKVGITGISYGFFTSVLTAALQPPHLRAIAPIHGSVSWFYCIHEGGLPMSFGYHGNYAAMMLAMQGLAPGYRADGWRELWKHRLETMIPWGLDWWSQLADDQTYDAESANRRYDRVKVPTFAIGGLWDRYPTDPLRLAENISAPVKVLIGPWQHARMDTAAVGPRLDYDIVVRWFDYWLKDKPNGIMDEPRFIYYAQRYGAPADYRPEIPGEWRAADRWPVPGGRVERWALGKTGSDSYDYDATAGACSGLSGGIYGPVGMAVDQRPDEAKSLVYTAEPLTREVEVTGIPRVTLRFSTTARVMGVIVKLCDVAPDGTVALVTRGYLNVCHRDGLDRPKEIKPGEVYSLVIEMKATSYVFEPGHRMRLAITSAEFPSLFATREQGRNTVYPGESYVELPVVAGKPWTGRSAGPGSRKSAPQFEVREADGKAHAELKKTDVYPGFGYTVHYSHHTTADVDKKRPADASVGSQCEFALDYEPGDRVVSKAEVQCRGDASNIYVTARVRVTEGGREVFRKDWSLTHPRRFL